MCTVTIIPDPRCGCRLICNRDEQRSRPSAKPPLLSEQSGHQIVMPIDPICGGTWIAATDRSLVMTLLNVNLSSMRPLSDPPRSRGEIIPSLCRADSLSKAVALAREIIPTDYAPFRLLIADHHRLWDLYSDGDRLNAIEHGDIRDQPRCFTSSGLGDDRVRLPRLGLFTTMLSTIEDPFVAQERFHEHIWPARPELSVCMSRPDARTVSRTSVVLGETEIEMVYQPLDDSLLAMAKPIIAKVERKQLSGAWHA